MDRRSFLKTLAALGASTLIPAQVAAASRQEVDAAWETASASWDLFEVNDSGTLSYANFEAPDTRRDAYFYSHASDLDVHDIERHWSLNERIKDLYRSALTEQDEPDDDAIESEVEDNWAKWVKAATGDDRAAIDDEIEAWLDEEPDWCNEADALYDTGTAQGAAYRHFLREDSGLMEALGIVVIEGDCPGSSYFAAELHLPIDEANAIAQAQGWSIRFVAEG